MTLYYAKLARKSVSGKTAMVRRCGLCAMSVFVTGSFAIHDFSLWSLGGLVITLIIGLVAAMIAEISFADNLVIVLAGSAIGVVVASIPKLKDSFSMVPLSMSSGDAIGKSFVGVVAGILICAVLRQIVQIPEEAPDSRKVQLGTLRWSVSAFALFAGIAYAAMNLIGVWSWSTTGFTWLLRNLTVFLFVGLAYYLQLRQGKTLASYTSAIAYALSLGSIVLPIAFPAFSFSGGDGLRDYLKNTMISTPVLVIGTVLVIAWLGVWYNCLEDDALEDEYADELMAVWALLGFAWTLRIVALCPIPGAVFALVPYLLYALWLVRCSSEGEMPDWLKPLPVFTANAIKLTIAAFALWIIVIVLNNGYYWAALFITVGVFLAFAVGRQGSWIREGFFWQIVVITVAAGAWGISAQRASLTGKTTLIIAVALVASVVLWMMVYHNEIGTNGFELTKNVMAVMLVAVMLLAAFKGAVGVSLKDQESVSAKGQPASAVSVVVKDPGAIASVQYAWTDGFLTDNAAKKPLTYDKAGNASIERKGRHLTIWLQSAAGFVTRVDRWYSDDGSLL